MLPSHIACHCEGSNGGIKQVHAKKTCMQGTHLHTNARLPLSGVTHTQFYGHLHKQRHTNTRAHFDISHDEMTTERGECRRTIDVLSRLGLVGDAV